MEWQRYVKEGVLTRIDLAWSRDQKEKFTYKTNCANRAQSCGAGSMTVPTFMSAATLIAWRKTLSNTLLEVIAEYGGMDTEAADEFLSELRVERRYQRDVY